jgi:murein DD-endopeptidase MepM/ murein hydrolase activator NlpD
VGDFMLLSKENANKNYSVIIIPERGSNTKTLKLSARFLKIVMTVFLMFLLFISFLVFYYFYQRNNIDIINQKDQHIQSLENSNKVNLEIISNYNREIENNIKNNDNIKKKLKEIQQLEDIVRNKFKKSISLKSINFNNSNYINISTNNEDLIKEIENKIVSLEQIDKKMDSIIKSEKFIPSILPCIGHISSYFGYRKNPFNKLEADFHPGIDIVCANGTKIYAAASGTVTFAGYCAGYGNEVVINHNNGIKTIYGHNSKVCVKVGQVAEKGDLIALSGSTGSSTGPHLHFEIRKNNSAIDPKVFFLKGEE